MDVKGAFLDSEGVLLHSLPKSGGHGPSGTPGSYAPGLGYEIIILMHKV